MFLFFVGCDGGMGGVVGSNSPQTLAGVKVLRKPSSYDFAEAVGENASEYFYNIFASYILKSIYEVFENNSVSETSRDSIFNELDVTNGETYGNFTGNNQYYLFDSLRYTISSVETTYDADGNLVSQKLTLNFNTGWNWLAGDSNLNLFENVSEDYPEAIIVEGNVVTFLGMDWLTFLSIFSGESYVPNVAQYYYGNQIFKNDLQTITDYYTSPYYDLKVAGMSTTDSLNYFQDALEYATYLFVLGYDYVNIAEDGTETPSEDAPYFDFEIVDNNNDGILEDMTVEWAGQRVSVVQALENAKQVYQERGNYIGLTDGENGNKEQLSRFIKDFVIGENAMADNVFSVALTRKDVNEDGITTGPVPDGELKFNRNYDVIVDNIIDYACSQVPIGIDDEGNNVNLDSPYVVSEIAEFNGDYFFLNYGQGGEGNDDEMFVHIDAAEYQSFILYPREEDLGKQLNDIWLAFEYNENPDPTKEMADSITINIGFRYFSAAANNGDGAIISSATFQKEVVKGPNGEFGTNGDLPDVNWVYFGNGKTEASQALYDAPIENPPIINGTFNNGIGNGVINPFISGTVIDDYNAVKLITGTNTAREYYKLNPSSSYGFYGTLNEAKFSKNVAGDQACDFIEIYFDVVKDKNASNINYNFKVGMVNFVALEN